MEDQDIRWKQRFANYGKALKKLSEAVELLTQNVENIPASFSEIAMEGLVQRFEYTHELAWNVLKDYLESKGFTDIHGSRDTIRLAFKEGYIKKGEIWMDMIKSRNTSSHTYDETTVQAIVKTIITSYFAEFKDLYSVMKKNTGE
jgi:nucleotidyltransferase substrate binding protein (TIGR01987 family)